MNEEWPDGVISVRAQSSLSILETAQAQLPCAAQNGMHTIYDPGKECGFHEFWHSKGIQTDANYVLICLPLLQDSNP